MSVRMNVMLNGELSGLDGLTERLTAADFFRWMIRWDQ